MCCPTWPMRLQALRSLQQTRFRCRSCLVYARDGASIAPYAHHSHAASQIARSAANSSDGATLSQRRAPLVLCKGWPGRVAALIEHLREASKQYAARCCRNKFDVACCCLRKHDLSLKCSRIRIQRIGVFTLGRWRCQAKFDVVSCLVCTGN